MAGPDMNKADPCRIQIGCYDLWIQLINATHYLLSKDGVLDYGKKAAIEIHD